MMKNRAVVIAAAALVLVLVGLWSLGALAESLVEERLSRRLGAPVDIGDLSLGFGSQDAADIAIGGPRYGLDVKVARVEIQASPFGLLTSGRRALQRVRVVGVRGRVNTAQLPPTIRPDRGDDRPVSSNEQTAGEGGAKARATRIKGGPTVQVESLVLTFHDEAGELLSAKCGRATLKAGELALFCPELRLGDKLASVAVEGLRAQAARTAAGLQLQSGSVDRISLQARPDAGGPISLLRTRAALSALRMAFLPAPARPLEDTPAEMSGRNRFARLFAMFAPGATFQVHDAGVEMVRDGQAQALLSGASVQLTAQEDGRLSSEGQGTAIGGGELRWSVVLGQNPFALQGDVDVDSLPLSLLASALPQVPWYEPERGRINAKLKLRTSSMGRVTWDGQLALADVAVESARLAPEPVTGIGFSLTGRGALLPLERRLEVEEGSLQIGQARLAVSGAAALNEGAYHLAIDADLPTTPCEAAVKAIPAALLGDLAGSTLKGSLAGQLHLLLDSAALENTELEIDFKDRCDFVSMPPSLDLRRFRRPFHHVVQESEDKVFEMDTGPGTEAYTYIENISPFLVHAVIAHEDARFFSHSGFSLLHIRNALVRNLQEGRYVVGASTISMQLVKNILLHREKTLARKLQEVLLTWYLERVMDKQEILELYLNVIEYGPEVYGIRHASEYYFKQAPADLSPGEAAFFATILPGPKIFHEYYERGALSRGGKSRLRTLVKRLEARGSYDEVATGYALAEVDNFKFIKQGEPLPLPRENMGQAEPLPYETGYWAGDEWGLTTTNRVTGRDLGFALPGR